jgi:hypothetical protein
MANLHKSFLQFNKNLQINSSKRTKLMKAKDALKDKIVAYLKEKRPGAKVDFFIQGSYKMGTLIKTKDDTCDLDYGVHLKFEPGVSPKQVQKWIYEAVKDHTTGGATIKKKCVRVIYQGDFHIDLPIYKQGEDDDSLWLAIKDESWDAEESDPKGFVEWYQDEKTDQLTRLSGLAMTLLMQEHYVEDDRDDIAFHDTMVAIEKAIRWPWVAEMPTKPYDNILADYSDSIKTNFKDRLAKLVADGEAAIEGEFDHKASKLWRKHLGTRYPLSDAGDNRNAELEAISSNGTYAPYFSFE